MCRDRTVQAAAAQVAAAQDLVEAWRDTLGPEGLEHYRRQLTRDADLCALLASELDELQPQESPCDPSSSS